MGIRIACYSDLHGILPDVVGCDIALIAGDICPECRRLPETQANWVHDRFIPWVSQFPKAVFIAGNHDYVFEHRYLLTGLSTMPDNVTYLRDSMVNVAGYNIWGCPWSLPYGTYAHMATEETIAEKLNFKGQHPDIIISHGPPFGYGDEVYRHRYRMVENTGSKALVDKIKGHKPKLVVCGHIHEGRGVYNEDETLIVNAAMAGESPGLYLEFRPIVVEFDDAGALVNLTL